MALDIMRAPLEKATHGSSKGHTGTFPMFDTKTVFSWHSGGSCVQSSDAFESRRCRKQKRLTPTYATHERRPVDTEQASKKLIFAAARISALREGTAGSCWPNISMIN